MLCSWWGGELWDDDKGAVLIPGKTCCESPTVFETSKQVAGGKYGRAIWRVEVVLLGYHKVIEL
jgi:hypothetical protein